MRILIAEDDNTTAMLLTRVLKKAGHDVVRVADGVAALESVKKDRSFDAILTDWMMPKMNGIEFLTAIRSNPQWKDLKVFILTTSDDRVDRDAAKKLGVSGYIVKPLKLTNPSSIDSFNLMIDLMNLKTDR